MIHPNQCSFLDTLCHALFRFSLFNTTHSTFSFDTHISAEHTVLSQSKYHDLSSLAHTSFKMLIIYYAEVTFFKTLFICLFYFIFDVQCCRCLKDLLFSAGQFIAALFNLILPCIV